MKLKDRSDGIEDLLAMTNAANLDPMMSRGVRREIFYAVTAYYDKPLLSYNKNQALLWVLRNFPVERRRTEKEIRELDWALGCPTVFWLEIFDQEWNSTKRIYEAAKRSAREEGDDVD